MIYYRIIDKGFKTVFRADKMTINSDAKIVLGNNYLSHRDYIYS